jgi:signal transduction histidine kinase
VAVDRTRAMGRYGDAAIALVLCLGVVIESWLLVPPLSDDLPAPPGPLPGALAVASALALAAGLAWRRRWPLAVLGLAIVASAASTYEALAGPVSVIAAIALASFTAGAETRGRAAAAAAVAVAVLLVATALRPATTIEEPADAAAMVMLVGGPWLAGLAIRARREREAVLALRAAELERDREARATAAVAEERARIARELHDVVAHAISVIVLQARAPGGPSSTIRGRRARPWTRSRRRAPRRSRRCAA